MSSVPVRIILDYSMVLDTQPDRVRVESIRDYVSVYAQMVKAIHDRQLLTITILHPTCAAWMQIAQEKYGVECIRIVNVTPRNRLAELGGVEIPAWITDEAVVRSGLLDGSLQARPGQSFENAVLESFYSPFLAYGRLPLPYLVDLLNSYDRERWSQADQRLLVREVLARRLQAWVAAATTDGERLLVEGVRDDPPQVMRTLAQIKVLAGYPDTVGRRAMGAEYDPLAALKLNLDALPVREAELADTVDQIRVHLNSLTHASLTKQTLATVVEQVSGHLIAEFEVVQALLKSGDIAVDTGLIRQIRQKFAPIRGQVEQELADLDLLVTPPRPPQPNLDGNWGADDWLAWAVDHYLPYRFWLEEIGRHDGEIAAQADAYTEWLYAHYPALRLTYPRMVYQGLLAVRDHLAGPAPVLVVVADNLNYKFFPDLVRYLQARGFFSQQVIPHLAMLPTCTEVSKKCLFVGQPEPFVGTAYEKPVLQAWEPALAGRRVRYLSKVGELRSITRREHDVYMLNYLPIDDALHANEEKTGVPTSAAVRQCLEALTADIRSFAERIGAERDLVVIFLSDHGSTRIPSTAPNPIDRRFYGSRVTDKHHRYVTIDDKALAALPANVRFECYVFGREQFGLPTNYLAARSSYRFTAAGENVYIHGGLSPEETVVPLAVFAPVAVTPTPLTIRLLTDELRYGVKLLIRIEIVNPNRYACQDLQIEIPSRSVQADPLFLEEMEALGHVEVEVEARIRRGSEKMTTLPVQIRYTFLGETHSQTVELPVKMKRLMTTTVDLNDL